MADNQDMTECRKIRERLEEDGEKRADAPDQEVEAHLGGCAGCRQWREQTADLLAMASQMPQFDVPEAVTQRILSAIEEKQRQRVRQVQLLVMVILVAVAAFISIADLLESMTGLVSWIAGLAALAALHVLLDGSPAHKTLFRH